MSRTGRWLAGAAGALVLAEVALRLFGLPGNGPDPRARRAAFPDPRQAAAILEETSRLKVAYSPFVMWKMAPGQAGAHFSVDARGFRGVRPPNDEGLRRVLLMGGSQAWGVGASSDRATVAGRLEEALQSGWSRPVGVLNAGQPGYVLRQQRILLFDELLDERWDVVVFLSGFNDVQAALQNGSAGDVQNADRFRQRFELDRGAGRAGADLLRALGPQSALLRLVERAAAPLRPRGVRGDSAALPPGVEAVLARVGEVYLQDARLIASICRQRGVRVIFALEPCLVVDKPLAPDEALALEEAGRGHPFYIPALKAGYARLRGAFARGGEEGLECVDTSRAFERTGEEIFIDEIHITDRGNELLARAIAAHVLASPRAESAR